MPDDRKAQTEAFARDVVAKLIQSVVLEDGKSLGELLYESMAEPFAFQRKWNPKTNPISSANYNAAAKIFALRLAQSLLSSEGGSDA